MINGYLNQKAKIATKKSRDVYGDIVENRYIETAVRFQESNRRVRNDKGEEVLVDGEVWTRADADFSIGDVILFECSKYKFVKVEYLRDINGNKSHKKGFVVRL